MEIYKGSLDICQIQNRWYEEASLLNCGALITFVGIVRAENGIKALSFDIYEPILKKWLDSWQNRAKNENSRVFFAHSFGDVAIHTSSYIAGVLSPKRKVALRMINEFVEDFKANAPIWKYDVIDDKRIYALHRSHKISGAGILANQG